VQYGLGVLATTAIFVAHKVGIIHSPLFKATGRTVALPHDTEYYSENPRR
jgi:hypothetical protein